jgi:hypothetical protein
MCIRSQELEHLGTEHLYEGLDQKVRPKKRHSNAGLAGAQGKHLGNLHATNRMKNNLIGYVVDVCVVPLQLRVGCSRVYC